ncbi:hypothetical protein CAQUA_01840 [Corynebacterium aquatimens]|nr:hypothetical protein CAQUA_01840 [Corynebacterium aquatimens]
MRRRWTAIWLIVLFIVLFIRFCVPSEADRQLDQWREWAEEAERERQAYEAENPQVEPSMPVELAIPSAGMRGEFSQDVCRFEEGSVVPPTADRVCIFTSFDRPYTLPGTDARDIVVLAGNDVFAPLYNGADKRLAVNAGDDLYLRTEKSGDQWLRYQALDLHNPSPENLDSSPEIWGDGPLPGRLLTVVNPDGDASAPAIVGWQLMGSATSQEVNAFYPGR